MLMNCEHVRPERIHRGDIRLPARADRDVERRTRAERREQRQPHELAQPALERIAIDRRVLVSRHDDAHTRKLERGSENPCIEVHGPNSPPLSNDGLNVTAPRQSVAARKTKAAVRRPRTCSAA